MRRAQVAIEYLSIIALSLAILLSLWLYVDGEANRVRGELQLGYAKQVVSRLRDAADLVYAQGPPAQILLEVDAPRGVQDVSIQGNSITISLFVPWGVSEVYATTIGPLQGSLESFAFEGPKRVLVRAQNNFTGTFVNITEATS